MERSQVSKKIKSSATARLRIGEIFPYASTRFSLSHAWPVLLATILNFFIFWEPTFINETLLVILFFTPILFGLWLGLKWRGSHLLAYALGGIIIGAGGTAGDWVAFGFFDADVAIILFPAAILMFTTGGIVGDWVERRRFGRPAEDGYSEKLARRLLESREFSDNEPEEADEDRIKKLSDAIAAITPILTFIGSIITATLAFLAAQSNR